MKRKPMRLRKTRSLLKARRRRSSWTSGARWYRRAAFVEDGEKIYIPPAAVDGTGEDEDASSSGQQVSRGDGRININTADSAQLQELDGIGPATAQKIIDYRKENGRFSSIEDIKNVSGIGDKSFEKIKDRIKV